MRNTALLLVSEFQFVPDETDQLINITKKKTESRVIYVIRLQTESEVFPENGFVSKSNLSLM